MHIDPLFFENLLDATRALLVSGIYVAATLALGARLLPPCGPQAAGLRVLMRFALGAAAFGTLFTVLAMLRVAYAPLVLALSLAPLVSVLVRKRHRAKTMRFALRTPALRLRALHIALGAAAMPFVAYALVSALALTRGGDMAIYHLVVPRTILWNDALVYNPFSHDAGLYYGWQIYALPAYIAGGDRAFELCAFAAFALVLWAAYRLLAGRYGSTAGLLGMLVAAALVCGMSRASVVNNDVPLVLIELAMLALACAAAPRTAAGWALGLLGGFAIAVKLVGVATLPVAYAVLLWRGAGTRPAILGALAASTFSAALPWPLFDYLSSGSPLPLFLLIWPASSGYLPQYRETIAYLMEFFGIWYRSNFLRLFTQGLEFVPALIAGVLLLPFARRARADPLCLALPAFGLARALILLAANGFSASVLFHDRYQLTSYLLVALGGLLCWMHLLEPAPGTTGRGRTFALGAGALAFAAYLFWTPVRMVDVRGPGLPTATAIEPSLAQGLRAARHTFRQAPGGGPGGIGYDVAARQLPKDAVIATTAIDPYLLQRRFLQILPVSENLIDLSLPPQHLLEAMRRYGATHLHLTEYSGLNVWMNPMVDRWLESLRRVPKLPGVHRLLQIDYGSAKGRQAFYALRPAPPAAAPLRGLSDVRLVREPDGTWWVHWRPEPGGEAHIVWRQAPGKEATMGVAASEMGAFPLRLGMPARFTLELRCVADGKIVQRVYLDARG